MWNKMEKLRKPRKTQREHFKKEKKNQCKCQNKNKKKKKKPYAHT